MSKRGTEFIERWVRDNFHARAPGNPRHDRRPAEWAQECTSAAIEAGIPREEIEEDFGDLEEFMTRTIADTADEHEFGLEVEATDRGPSV